MPARARASFEDIFPSLGRARQGLFSSRTCLSESFPLRICLMVVHRTAPARARVAAQTRNRTGIRGPPTPLRPDRRARPARLRGRSPDPRGPRMGRGQLPFPELPSFLRFFFFGGGGSLQDWARRGLPDIGGMQTNPSLGFVAELGAVPAGSPRGRGSPGSTCGRFGRAAALGAASRSTRQESATACQKGGG